MWVKKIHGYIRAGEQSADGGGMIRYLAGVVCSEAKLNILL